MSGNLIADLTAVVILYFVGRSFLDRAVAERITVRSIPTVILPTVLGGQPSHEVGVFLANHATEPIFDLSVSLGRSRPFRQSEHDLRIDFVFPPGNDTEFAEILRPGETVELDPEPLVHPEGEFLLVSFYTVRGKRRTQVVPVSVSAGLGQRRASVGLRMKLLVWRRHRGW